MAELKRHRKADLMTLAVELGIDLGSSNTIKSIIEKIQSANDYDEELAIEQIKIIKGDREKAEQEALELKEKEKRDLEISEREKERQHELAKIQLTQGNEIASVSSAREENSRSVSLKSLIRPFDPEKSEITLFLALFEKQAKKAKINEDDFVMQLLPLLPTHLAEGIMKLSEEQVDNYECVKSYLLDRFRVNAETYRQKFMQTAKSPNSLWKDLAFELRTYLTGWLSELKVETYDELVDLLIADQLKKRASYDMKDKFIDKWSHLIEPDKLASDFDEFDSVRKPLKELSGKFEGDERKANRYSNTGK